MDRLRPEDIVDPAKISTIEMKVVDFPEDLPYSKEETAAFKTIHELLTTLQHSSFGLKDTDTFGQHYKLENLRVHVLRFLWILGRFGKFEKDKRAHLAIDARMYLANRGSEKTLAIWTFLKDTVFRILSEFGISCERVTSEDVQDMDLVTGTDYLRNRGWVIRMSFDDKIGGSSTLSALQIYARKIDESHGKKSFQHFKEADFRVPNKT